MSNIMLFDQNVPSTLAYQSKSASVRKQLNLITMLVIILQIYTNSLQYTKISIETIFVQIRTYSLFRQIWYCSSIFDHFPTSENFSIKFQFVHFLAKIGIIAYSIIFRHRKTFRSYSYFFLFTLDHFPTSILDQIPT